MVNKVVPLAELEDTCVEWAEIIRDLKGYAEVFKNTGDFDADDMAYVDLRNLYPHHIGMTADGRKYIREKRAKTNNEAFIPLHLSGDLSEKESA